MGPQGGSSFESSSEEGPRLGWRKQHRRWQGWGILNKNGLSEKFGSGALCAPHFASRADFSIPERWIIFGVTQSSRTPRNPKDE